MGTEVGKPRLLLLHSRRLSRVQSALIYGETMTSSSEREREVGIVVGNYLPRSSDARVINDGARSLVWRRQQASLSRECAAS